MQPLNNNEWRVMGTALKQVFSSGRSLVLASTLAFAVFLVSVWHGNFGLVWQTVTSGSVPIADKVNILLALTGSITTNFSIFSALSSITIALLFGANVALLDANFRARQVFASRGESAASLGGLASGLFGVGCAACSSFAFGSTLSVFGAGTLMSLLPFGGAEFGIMGMGLLSWALVLSLTKLTRALSCQVPDDTGKFATQSLAHIETNHPSQFHSRQPGQRVVKSKNRISQ